MQFTHRIDSLKWVQYSTKGEECLSLDRDEASKDISCSSCQKFLVRQTGKCCYNVVDSFSLFLCWSHALFAFPSATWHTKHISRHWSPDSPCGLQVPFYTTPTSPRNLLQVKGIVVSITRQKGGKNCRLKAQGKETGILYRLLNVQFKTWWIGRWKAPAEKWREKLHFGLGETCAYNIKDVQINK